MLGNREMTWERVDCQEQTELECGPRTLWAILMLCCGFRKTKPMTEIMQKIANLGEIARREAAELIRHEIAEFGGGKLQLMNQNRLWGLED